MEEIAKLMRELADKLGPTVVDAARGAAQTDAYSTLMSGVWGIVICTGLTFVGRTLWNRGTSDEELPYIGAMLIWLVALIWGGCSVWQIIDPWTWTAINHPDLWIAKRVLHL